MGEVDNRVEQAKGHVKEAVGDLTDDDELRARGSATRRRARSSRRSSRSDGKIEEGVDKVKDKLGGKDSSEGEG